MSKIGNPFSQMLGAFKPDRFFGRRLERETILPGISSADPKSFAVAGARTLGKTTLLKYLCHPEGAIAQDEHLLGVYGPTRPGRLKFIYSDLFPVTGSNILNVLCQKIVESKALSDFMPLQDGKNISGDTNRADVKETMKITLKTAHAEGLRLVLCLDHADTALETLNSEDEMFLRSLIDKVSFIIATERTLDELYKARLISSPFLNLFVTRHIGLLSEDEARQLIVTPVEEVEEVVKNPGFTPSEVDFLLKTAGRQPYLLTLVCEYLFNLWLEYPELRELLAKSEEVKQRVIIQMEALPAVIELFSLFWTQLEDCERATLYRIAVEDTINQEKEQPALTKLRQNALIYQNLQDGKYHLFSDLFRHSVRRQGHPHRRRGVPEVINDLSPIDRKLYEYLLERPNQICTFEELITEIWNDPGTSKRGLEAAIHRLRTRLQDLDGTGWEYIQNVRGKGYQYVPKPG